MIRRGIADQLRDRTFAPGFVRPAYDGYCFANVPATAAALLGVDLGRELPDDVFEGVETDVSHVLAVVVDGLRFDRWVDHRRSVSLLDRLTTNGAVTPLTTIYPSETTAAITTLHTGLQPVEHGLFGWEQYVPDVEGSIEPLPFRTPDGRDPSSAFDRPIRGRDLFEGDTVGMAFEAAGVDAAAIQPASTLGTPYASRTLRGTRPVSYRTVAEGAVSLRQRLESVAGRSYTTLYCSEIDTLSHHRGTRTAHYEAVLAMLADALEREFDRLDPAVAAETMLVVVADHGHLDIDPKAGVRLDRIEGLLDEFARDTDGRPIGPTGSGRNVHLRVRDGRAAAVAARLRDELDALAWTRDEASDSGLFGDRPAGTWFESRCGDVVVTHRDRVLWDDSRKFVSAGQHGGLSPAEQLVPFAACRLDRL
ncbi:alkaline phosphatase family protein [Haloferacaceae archaeon DSL9]